MKQVPGTIKAAVMLQPPYGAVVIYDSSKVTKDQILAVATKNEPAVKLEGIIDQRIKKLPIVLVPKDCQSNE
jgi:hypothetical protein